MSGHGTYSDKSIPFLILLVAGIAVCSNTLQVPFYFDDKVFIADNPAIKDFRHFLDPSMADRSGITPPRVTPSVPGWRGTSPSP